jgi:hypothetical protein
VQRDPLFSNPVDLAVEQIMTACRIPPTRNDNLQFALPPLLATPLGLVHKISQKQLEPLKTVISVKNPNICILLNKLQVTSESFGWNPLLQISISQEIYNTNVQNLLSTHRKCTI